jgi:lipopolysaccharide export system protein LptA
VPGRPLPWRYATVILACAVFITVAGIAPGPSMLNDSANAQQVFASDEAAQPPGQSPENKSSASRSDGIRIQADWLQEWQAEREHVGLFRGQFSVEQGELKVTADKACVWVETLNEEAEAEYRLTIYLEDRVVSTTPTGTTSDASQLVVLTTKSGITLDVRGRQQDEAGEHDAFYQRAEERRSQLYRVSLKRTQLTIDDRAVGTQAQTISMQSGNAGPTGVSQRRIRVFPRSAIPYNIQSFRSENTTPAEQIALITGGVTLIVEGVAVQGVPDLGTIDLSADRAIVWTDALNTGEFSADQFQPTDARYQVYLEGNIIVRQGDSTVIQADRAFYDVRENRALIYGAELRSQLPDDGVTVRLRAERIRQLAVDQYVAQNAWVTTSLYGRPGYRIQSQEILYEQRDNTWFNRNVPPKIDPATGQVMPQRYPWITATGNTLFVDDVPLFYTPSLSAPAEDPNIPIQAISFRQDRIFGTQFRTRFDTFSLLGIERPAGTNWSIDANYLSQRGPQFGTDGNYRGIDGAGNPFFGQGLGLYVNDSGRDNLGFDRRSLSFSDPNRGLLQLQHRHLFDGGLEFQGEAGYASDRNVREQYREADFDRGKDLETLGQLKQNFDTLAWTALVRPQVNQFENNTQWLPKVDGYVLGQPIFNGLLSYSSHSSIGYGQLNQAQAPTIPGDVFTPLPYFAGAEGAVGQTRHEVELPLSLGPLNVVPYALGEAAFWGDNGKGDSIDRLYGRAGLRGSVQFWRVFPYVQSEVFNLNGLAHRMIFDANYGYAVSSRDLSSILQWNEFDDDAQERFRQRLVLNTFGGVLPGEFDPRFYAVRSGASTGVTASANELVDDQQVLNLGWRHRLQTKVGPPNRLRIKDWMTLDLGVNFYPDAKRDNFGENFGLFSTRYAWYVGDRTSLHASSLTDFFDNGQNIWNVGVLSQRSVRGSVYVGLRNISGGPLQSQILTASYSYVMSPKWISTMGTAFDLGEGQNRGQSFTLTRVGESFLVHLGFNFDASKNNAGLGIAIEPKLGNRRVSPASGNTQLGPLLGTGY